MKLSIGIVGLPNVGKSTLFNLLTKKEVDAANYPFCTIDPNVGVVEVPDERLQWLNEMSRSEKKIPAVVEFYDIAGLVKGANKGAGLGNKFLTHIREVDAILMVLRCFKNGDIIHVEESVDPLRDLEIINTELILKDLETVEKRLVGLEKELRGSDKALQKIQGKEREILEKVKERLNNNELIQEWAAESVVRNLGLLSAKKQIYLLNGNENEVSEGLKNRIGELGGVFFIADLAENPDEALKKLIQEAYKVLDLISFFTTGPQETRAWTVRRGAKAPEAAGVIHSDFENKFIRAEVVNYEKLKEAQSWLAAKNKGWIKLEGKDYEMQDGDVVFFHHS